MLGICNSRPLALCLAPGPGFRSWPPICVYQPCPAICIYQPWLPNVFIDPGSQFVFTGPGLQFYYQSEAWVCIYQPCLLNLHSYLRSWLTICITGPGPEFAFTSLLVVVAVVVVIAVVVISLEQVIPIFVCRF